MNRIIVILLIIFIATSCNQKKGEYYFGFDEIDHYSIEIEESELYEIEESKYINDDQKLQIDIIINEKPEHLIDTLFIKKLEHIGFKKKTIDQDKFGLINEIFRKKNTETQLGLDVPLYIEMY